MIDWYLKPTESMRKIQAQRSGCQQGAEVINFPEHTESWHPDTLNKNTIENQQVTKTEIGTLTVRVPECQDSGAGDSEPENVDKDDK